MTRILLPLFVAAALGSGCKAGTATVVPGAPEAPTALVSTTGVAAEQAPSSSMPSVSDLEHAFERAAKRIGPSVVSITNSRSVEVDIPEFLKPFTDGEREVRGMGSGVILDNDGHILTNNHVVEGATVLRVRLDDDRELDAEIVGTDPKSDLAVIQVDAKKLRPAKTGDSDSVRVGQWVLAAGSPFGLPRTVTAGIVSATGRGSMGIADYGDFIQTDAAVNQGNSGGPLIDLEGRVIGINTAIASRNGGSNGIGFAIPMNLARNVVDQLLTEGVVRRGWLGIVMGDLNKQLASSFGYKTTHGILINDLDPKGPAKKAGVKTGDIIAKLDGKKVENMGDFRNAIAQTRPGKSIKLSLWRGKAFRDVSVKLGVLPGQDKKVRPRRTAKKKKGPAKLGVVLRDAPPNLVKRLGLPKGSGVLVSDVATGSVASKADVRHGDILLQVGDKPVKSAKTAQRLLERADLDKGVRVRIRRGPFGYFVVLKRE